MNEAGHERPKVNPSALSQDDAAMLLTRAEGSPLTTEMLRADLKAGAPPNTDAKPNGARPRLKLSQLQRSKR